MEVLQMSSNSEIIMSPEQLESIVTYLNDIITDLDGAIVHSKYIGDNCNEFCKNGNSKEYVDLLPDATKKLEALRSHYKIMREHAEFVKAAMSGLDYSISDEINKGFDK